LSAGVDQRPWQLTKRQGKRSADQDDDGREPYAGTVKLIAPGPGGHPARASRHSGTTRFYISANRQCRPRAGIHRAARARAWGGVDPGTRPGWRRIM